MRHALVKVPVSDIRAQGDFRSERLSQALFGSPLEVLEAGHDYSMIRQPDGYTGWMKTAHLEKISLRSWQTYRRQLSHVVKSPVVPIKIGGRWADPFRLYFGTQLVVTERKGLTFFSLPGGVNLPIRRSALRDIAAPGSGRITGGVLVRTAKRFIGVPYLWGGITPAGIDCSGLVQTVCLFHGVEVPRDSKDQGKCGFAVERSELCLGDLLFFKGHVAVSCGSDEIIHASQLRGLVAVESLNPQKPAYRRDLDKGFLFARRLEL